MLKKVYFLQILHILSTFYFTLNILCIIYDLVKDICYNFALLQLFDKLFKVHSKNS